MAIAINSTIQNLRFRLVNGPAGQFFQWWGEELGELMPAQFRARMQYARRHLLMQVGDGEIALSIEGADTTQSLDSFSTVQDPQLQQQRVRDLLQQHELTEVSRDLLLPEADVLRTEVVMPLAAEANLGRALAYEMDRHTPFLTPREPVETKLELLKRLGLKPTGIDVTGPDGLLGINLLPQALRHRIVNKQARLNWAIAAGTVILLVFVMAQSLWLREHQVEAITEAIDGVRAEALAVQQIRQQIDDASEAAGFMQTHKVQNGYKVEVLAELTRILPADTFLDRLSMHAETTQMQGKSDNAQGLIELINDSPYFENASFRGPTRLDNRSRKEIFDLSANNIQQDAG